MKELINKLVDCQHDSAVEGRYSDPSEAAYDWVTDNTKAQTPGDKS